MANTVEKFWRKINKTDGCWLWVPQTQSAGYGQFRMGAGKILAHRLSYSLANGPVPDEVCVLHTCDVRRCVRPDHLFLGTKGDNNRDTASKGRFWQQRAA